MNRECDQLMGELYDMSVRERAARKQQPSLFLALKYSSEFPLLGSAPPHSKDCSCFVSQSHPCFVSPFSNTPCLSAKTISPTFQTGEPGLYSPSLRAQPYPRLHHSKSFQASLPASPMTPTATLHSKASAIIVNCFELKTGRATGQCQLNAYSVKNHCVCWGGGHA